jgi:hypothetical protein
VKLRDLLIAMGARSAIPKPPQVIDDNEEILERETRLELATSTLARLRSTN